MRRSSQNFRPKMLTTCTSQSGSHNLAAERPAGLLPITPVALAHGPFLALARPGFFVPAFCLMTFHYRSRGVLIELPRELSFRFLPSRPLIALSYDQLLFWRPSSGLATASGLSAFTPSPGLASRIRLKGTSSP